MLTVIMDSQESTPISACEENSSTNEHEGFIKKLSTKFNYDYHTFWDKIPKAKVMIQNQSTIVTASKDLVAGLFLKKKCNEIMSLALDLSFYVKQTPTETSFVYEKVSPFVSSSLHEKNDHSAEVMIDLSPKGWYDQWINKTGSQISNGFKQRFLDVFNKPENEATISFLGPWLATVLLRLEKHHPSHVANKITKLFKHADITTHLNRSVIFLDNTSMEEWELLLKRFSKVSLDKQKRNALYRAMLEIKKENENICGILNFTTLQTFFLGGMTLVTLIEKLYDTIAHSCTNLAEMLELLEIETLDTKESWRTYVEFKVLMNTFSKDERYFTCYARAFDSEVFEDLTYAKNMKLCNRLAVLDDIAVHPQVSRYSVSNIGPAYKQLISNRKNVELLTNDDFRFCHNAAENASLKSAMEGGFVCDFVVKCSKERAQEQQKIADEALKNAQFEQMLADKYRSFAEEEEKKFRCLESMGIEQTAFAQIVKWDEISKNKAPWKPPKFGFGSLKLEEKSEGTDTKDASSKTYEPDFNFSDDESSEAFVLELPQLGEQERNFDKADQADAEDVVDFKLGLSEPEEQEEKLDNADSNDSLSAMFAEWEEISKNKAPLEPYEFDLTLL